VTLSWNTGAASQPDGDDVLPTIRVRHGDVLTHACDVLVLKYAQARFGADEAVARALNAHGQADDSMAPHPGGFRLIETHGAIAATRVFFAGVPALHEFGYSEVRDFARKSLVDLAGRNDGRFSHIAFTMHGPGYGLDEREAFESLVAGILDAVETEDLPEGLSNIDIVERNPGRARRLTGYIDAITSSAATQPEGTTFTPAARAQLSKTGLASESKPHVFVAMPFKDSKADHYHYGIQGAAHAAGYLCERMDFVSFTGDIMARMKERISTAEFVIADLSGANPNVYLEVGYAWGVDVPTVLLIDQADDLKFDVQGQRCIPYGTIHDLEQKLTTELINLRTVQSQYQPPSGA
jgi:hypothetical protein